MSLSAVPYPLATCGICDNPYSATTHVPKLLPCAHTVCSICIPRFQSPECPWCRTSLKHLDLSQSKTNFALLEINEELSQRARPVASAASSVLSPPAPAPSANAVSAPCLNQPSSETPAPSASYTDPTTTVPYLAFYYGQYD